jgi:hypothetical protein
MQRAMFDRLPWLRTWALATDPRVWLLILALASATLGRSGVFRSQWFALLKPWKRRPSGGNRPEPASTPSHPLRDPWFLFLMVLSATAVASWIVMSMTATGRNHP